MINKEIELKDVIKYLKENNDEEVCGEPLDYLLEEGFVSKEWYEAILEIDDFEIGNKYIDLTTPEKLYDYLAKEMEDTDK